MKELLDSDRINFLVWRFVVYSPCTPMFFFEMQPANLALFFLPAWQIPLGIKYVILTTIGKSPWFIFFCYVFVGYFL